MLFKFIIVSLIHTNLHKGLTNWIVVCSQPDNRRNVSVDGVSLIKLSRDKHWVDWFVEFIFLIKFDQQNYPSVPFFKVQNILLIFSTRPIWIFIVITDALLQ